MKEDTHRGRQLSGEEVGGLVLVSFSPPLYLTFSLFSPSVLGNWLAGSLERGVQAGRGSIVTITMRARWDVAVLLVFVYFFSRHSAFIFPSSHSSSLLLRLVC